MEPVRALRSPRTWLMPILLIAALAAALPAVYLAATADPQGHLQGLPVALVIEEQQPSTAPSAAEQVAAAIESNVGGAISTVRMTSAELAVAMSEDRVAGAVVVPPDFNASLASLSSIGTEPFRSTVKVATNAGDGGLSAGLVTANLLPVLQEVSAMLGQQLIAAADAPPDGAYRALLADPFAAAAAPYAPLPPNSGLGTSAFYFSLIVVLIAFIGASLVNPLVDSALGVIPSELGPLVARQRYTAVSRRRTFLAKCAILAGAAPVAAGVLLGVSALIGVTVGDPAILWLFSTVVIAAIGTSALAVFAILGPGIGSLANTLFFVALAMVSSGGIVPLEATPSPFQWVSGVTPFRHVIDGVRALFYFDGNLAAGLGEAWISAAIGGAVGLTVGLLATTIYGRYPRFSRDPRAVHGHPGSVDGVPRLPGEGQSVPAADGIERSASRSR